jgi:hypothetical protein
MKERTVAECERLAEENGFTGAIAGNFPDIPLPPVPRFLPPSYAPAPRRVYERMRVLVTPDPEEGA